MQAGIAVHAVNNVLIGLTDLSPEHSEAIVLDVPGGGRLLIAPSETIRLVAELLGTSSRATNPYEQRRRKEFLRRAGRSRSRPTEGNVSVTC